jgi:hypothetical protein
VFRRMVVVLAMASVAASGVVLAVSPAGARVASASNCKALQAIHITPSSDLSANGGRANANKLIKALDKAAKSAKGDFKNVLKTMSSYFKALVKADTTALANNAQAFGNAVTKFSNYLVTNCVPGGLPNGVTIPTIPTH